jgi:hypothetical protein
MECTDQNTHSDILTISISGQTFISMIRGFIRAVADACDPVPSYQGMIAVCLRLFGASRGTGYTGLKLIFRAMLCANSVNQHNE